jgi:hypothetical protein
MSEIRVNKVIDEAGTGAVELTQGATIPSGKTLSGAGSLNLSGTVNATALTGTPDITVGSVTGTTGSFSGNVSVGGTLTYEDVTNIDAVGLVTARTGVRVNAGGVVVTAGISTFKGAHFDGGLLKEKANIVATRLSDVSGNHVDLENGMTHIYTQDEDSGGASLVVNIRVSSSVQLMDRLALGETISVNIITKPNNAGYIDEITVDSAAVTEEWNGGAAPSSANSGGFDMTTVQITRIATTGTEATDLVVQCSSNNFA